MSEGITALGQKIARQIALQGPMTVADYMAQVLTDSAEGYYMTNDPFGQAGDFTTAPEISQMFGELLGLWCTEVWRRMGEPAAFNLVELGPGRGTMMSDMLRAAQLAPGFLEAMSLHLVEVSPTLKDLQGERLGNFEPNWHDDVTGVPEGPTILVANEFFDALPIRQFARAEGGWCERLIVLNAQHRLALTHSPPLPGAEHLVPEALRGAQPGEIVEVSPTSHNVIGEIGRRVATDGGAALLIDFGPRISRAGETLQAVRQHKAHDILDAPGTADLTAHVDFASLMETAKASGGKVHGPVSQGRFLRRLGLDVRADALVAQATEEQAQQIESARHRLCDTEEMGALFQVIAVASPALGVLDDLED